MGGYNVFQSCIGLNNIFIPNSVTSLGLQSFRNSGLTSIIIPNSVTEIGESAFGACSSLTTVVIGNSVTSIDAGAFRQCPMLKQVNNRATIPQTISNSVFAINFNLPFYARSIDKLFVPAQSLDAYKTAAAQGTGWQNFRSIAAMPFMLDSISVPLVKSATQTLTAIFDAGYTGDRNIIWTTSNPAVATVSQDGKITAVSFGTAIVTAMLQDDSFYDQCVVEVRADAPAPPTPIRDIQKSDGRTGIRLSKNVVSDKAEFEIILPNDKVLEVKAVIYDNTGNVVFEKIERGASVSWNLTNGAGRNVANGTYLIIAEARGAKGVYAYSAKVGVKR